jgi:starch-binding outer membrane protein, SusD/RagB family
MFRTKTRTRATRPCRPGLLSTLAVAVVALAGCDGILDVELPGQLTEEDLLRPEMAPMMVNSAIADYECGFSEFVASIGGLEDTFWESTGWFTRAWAEYQVQATTASVNTLACGTSDTSSGFFQAFQASRFQAEQAYDAIQGFEGEVADREQLLASAAVYAGLNYQLFGEHWCEMTADVGPVLTPRQTLGIGEEWFDRAVGHLATSGDFSTATTPSMLQLAHLGRARVRFALGDHQGAAQDAAQVEPGFVAWVTRDGAVRPRWNQIYQHHTRNQYSTVADTVWHNGEVVSTGYRHATIDEAGNTTHGDGVPDPRVPVEYTGGTGQDGVTPHWIQTKYTGHSSDIPMARWAEAQLILAEIEGGQQAVDRINGLRDVHGLPHFSSSEPQEIQDQIIEERRREFFYEGRFHADKLRYDLWFPRGEGFNHKGVAYGTTTCLPLANEERVNNPNIS